MEKNEQNFTRIYPFFSFLLCIKNMCMGDYNIIWKKKTKSGCLQLYIEKKTKRELTFQSQNNVGTGKKTKHIKMDSIHPSREYCLFR